MNNDHLDEQSYGTGKKKISVYLTGIILCVVFTLIPFMVVIHDDKFSETLIYSVIFISAIIQFIAQVICFLRLNTKNEQGRMNVLSFALTIIILAVIVAGSLWIMWSLGYNMSS